MGKLIQIENSAVNIALSLLEQFKRQNICITDEFPSPAGKVLISGLWWLNGWIRKGPPIRLQMYFREPGPGFSDIYGLSLPGHEVQFVQAVKVRLSTPAQLSAAGATLPESVLETELHLVFNLRAQETTTDVLLGIAFAGIEGLPALPGLESLTQKIASLFPSRRIPLQVSSLTRSEGNPSIANVGIAITVPGPVSEVSELNQYSSVGKTMVGIRIEIGEPPVSSNPWRAFLAGEAGTSFIEGAEGQIVALERSWSLFRDEYFVTEEAKRYLERELQKSSEFELQGGIAASWSNPGGRPTVKLNFYGEAEDVLDVEVDVTVEFAVSKLPTAEPLAFQPGVLQSTVSFDVTKSAWDTFWLTLGGWVVNPWVGAFVWGELNKGVPLKDQRCVPSGYNTYICQEPFDSRQVNIGGLATLSDVWGHPDGMVLKGDAYWMRQLASEFHIAAIDVQPFKLDHVRISCGQLGAAMLGRIGEHPEDFVTYTANVSLIFEFDTPEADVPIQFISHSNSDRIPPAVCAVRVRPEDDPLNVFAPHVSFDYAPDLSSTLMAKIKVNVPLANVPPAYFTDAGRYPCYLLIQTSVGTRMIKLPAIQQADAGAVKSMAIAAWARRVSECYAKSRSFNPTWKVDPGDYYNERHFWDVIVAGLRSGEEVSLRDQQGRAVSAMRADGGGTARLRAFLSPDEYDGRLSFRRSAAPPPRLQIQEPDPAAGAPLPENYIRIDVKQTQFLLQSEIGNGKPVVAAASIMLGARHALLVVQPSGVVAYDVSQPQQPRAAAYAALPCLSGALSTSNRILAWGGEGIFAFEINLEQGEISIDHLSKTPTLAMTRLGQRLFTLGQECVGVWDQKDHREELFKAPHAHCLAATSAHLLVGSNNRVEIYQVLPHYSATPVAEHRVDGLSRMVASNLIGREGQVILEGSSKSELLDVSDPGRVAVLSSYTDMQGLGSLSRHRGLLIEADENGMLLRVYSIGATAFI
ncbi:MAG: hypothetical protein ACLGJB_21940 [Blastocatellia bacterium]